MSVGVVKSQIGKPEISLRGRDFDSSNFYIPNKFHTVFYLFAWKMREGH